MARSNDARNEAGTSTGPRISGKVLRTVTDRGFGFIAGQDGQEYFFHYSNCATGVWDQIGQFPNGGKGVSVSFEPTQTPKGIRATSVQL